MKFLTAYVTLLISTAVFSQVKKKPADPLAGIEAALQQVLKDRKAAGFAVLVVKKDSVVYAKGFGYRDMEKKLPVTPNTLFAIGSCTKAFTSALMGLLNKEGKLDYDKPARDYLPDLKFFDDALNNHVTVRDMMCHRTGLPRHDYSWYLFSTKSRDSLVKRIQYMEPTAPLRQIYQYNNFMFLAQGVIAEKLYGKKWEDIVKTEILQPLNMKHTVFSVEDMSKSTDAAIGYRVYKDSIIKKMDYYNIDAMGPAGSINSSVNEMANWVITWIHGGKYKGKEILPAPYVSMAMSSQMVSSPGLPDNESPDVHLSTYGFAWGLSSYRGHYRVQHGGNIDGFSAITCFFPSDSIGIVVLANQNGSAVPGIVRNIIADRMLGLTPVDWNERTNKAEAKAKAQAKEVEKNITETKTEGTHLSHDLKDYTGWYHHDGYGTIEVTLDKDSLFIATPQGKSWLSHYHYDVFRPFTVDKTDGIDTSEKSPLRIQFHSNTGGEISKVTIPFQPGLDDITFTRKQKAKETSKAELEKYAGDYEFAPGAGARFYIKGENTLYVFIEGQPEYELVMTANNKFYIKILPDYKVEFEENAKGEIISVTFVQPNGNFKAVRK